MNEFFIAMVIVIYCLLFSSSNARANLKKSLDILARITSIKGYPVEILSKNLYSQMPSSKRLTNALSSLL